MQVIMGTMLVSDRLQ